MPIEDRELAAGTVLVARYKKQDRTCKVVETADGPRYRLDDGTEHKSPSSAGKAAMGGVACNGWHFWSVEGTEKPKREPKAKAEPKKKPAAKGPAKTKAAKKGGTTKSAKPKKSRVMRAAAKSGESYGCADCDETFPTIEEATGHLAAHTS
jgi:hypothetical protein